MSTENNAPALSSPAGHPPSLTSAKVELLQILSSLKEMGDVDKLIRASLGSESTILTEIPLYLLELGGKRMRPALTLLCSHAFGMETASQKVIDVAAGIELIHMATLLHDDIIDKSPLRRHKESPYVKFGTPKTLLSGDFLLVRAFSLCARLDRFIINETEQACIELTEGEVNEFAIPIEDHTLESSLEIARKKTAALFRLAATCGSYLAGADETAVSAMSAYGENLGIAFQILDDILDVTADQDLLGKPSGIDILERKPSYPNMLWLSSGDKDVQELFTGEPLTQDSPQLKSAIQELCNSPYIPEAKAKAAHFVETALNALEKAEQAAETAHKQTFEALRTLARFTLERML